MVLEVFVYVYVCVKKGWDNSIVNTAVYWILSTNICTKVKLNVRQNKRVCREPYIAIVD